MGVVVVAVVIFFITRFIAAVDDVIGVATGHYDNALGMMAFVCNVCYEDIVEN